MAPERTGLLVDWGGVMTSDVFASFAAYCAAEGLRPDTVRDAFRTDPTARALLGDLERGMLADADFEQRLGAVLDLEHPAGLIERLFGHMTLDPKMLDAVAAFRAAGVRTGLLSNSWGTATYDRSRFTQLFDVLVISGELGTRKPEPEIYLHAVCAMGLPAAQLIFVDDLPGNLKPARDLGMATVRHTEAASTVAQLEELLEVQLAR